MAGNTTFQKPLAQYRILLILAELDTGAKSTVELAEALCIQRSGVPIYLKHMGARVAEWRRTTGNLVPVYDMRPLPDVPRPSKEEQTRAARRRKWDKLKADSKKYAEYKRKQNIRMARIAGRGYAGRVIVIDGNVNTA